MRGIFQFLYLSNRYLFPEADIYSANASRNETYRKFFLKCFKQFAISTDVTSKNVLAEARKATFTVITEAC